MGLTNLIITVAGVSAVILFTKERCEAICSCL
ncbi:hypothetical protein OIU84_024991 [Salix udensis]|uniref:Uncharacterized protein n=1 Tax=Salix udensis TaxID=889485 RepID=A0AAD6PBB9_9ROSI|nr:hypothetical protein OIU84_024991 [Salix udensis]